MSTLNPQSKKSRAVHKEKCAWLHNFQDIQEARATLSRFIDHYNLERPHWAAPHQALNYRTLREVFITHQPTA